MKEPICDCEDFKKAQEEGTDKEGYGAAIRRSMLSDNESDLEVGGYGKPIKFCPWCGKRVRE